LPLSTSGLWETRADEKSKKKAKKEQLELEKQKEMDLKKKQEMKLKKKMMGEKMSPEEKIKLSWEKIQAEENSAAVVVYKALKKKGPGAGIAAYEKLKASGDDTYYFKEGEFNTLGYVFLHGKKVDEAIEVFKINVMASPESWNVYDSLGEALMVAGKLDKAKKFYEKSLVLNPDNENGKEMLAKLEQLKKNGKTMATSD
jgi:predicted Zn-dependent protease